MWNYKVIEVENESNKKTIAKLEDEASECKPNLGWKQMRVWKKWSIEAGENGHNKAKCEWNEECMHNKFVC